MNICLHSCSWVFVGRSWMCHCRYRCWCCCHSWHWCWVTFFILFFLIFCFVVCFLFNLHLYDMESVYHYYHCCHTATLTVSECVCLSVNISVNLVAVLLSFFCCWSAVCCHWYNLSQDMLHNSFSYFQYQNVHIFHLSYLREYPLPYDLTAPP